MPKKSENNIQVTPAAPKSRTPSAGAKKAASKSKPAAKPAKTATAKVSSPKRARAGKSPAKPTFEDIQLRAYFVAEKRQREGRPGDERQDWLEAERQLLAELNAASKTRTPARRGKNGSSR